MSFNPTARLIIRDEVLKILQNDPMVVGWGIGQGFTVYLKYNITDDDRTRLVTNIATVTISNDDEIKFIL